MVTVLVVTRQLICRLLVLQQYILVIHILFMIMMHFCLTYLEKETSLRNKINPKKYISKDILEIVLIIILEEVYEQIKHLLETICASLKQEDMVASILQRMLKV